VTAEGVVTSYIDGTTWRAARSQLRNRLRDQERQLPGAGQRRRRADRQAQSGRCGRAGRDAYSQDGFGPTLEDVRKGLIGKIGENMSFRRFKRFASGAKLAPTCTARASAWWSSLTATTLLPRTLRCTWPP
jgi:elongation factor Ts